MSGGRMRAIVGVIAALCAPSVAAACTCTNIAEPTAEMARASRVIAGYVAEVGPPDARHGFEARVVVSDVWKGPDVAEITVHTSDPGSACGLPLTVGSEWVLYVVDRGDAHTVSSCSASTSAVDAALAWLGPPAVHRAVERPVPAFEAALEAGDAAGVRAAIAAGADPEQDVRGGRPLDRAIARCQPDVVRALNIRWIELWPADTDRALACPDPVAMVRALGVDLNEWLDALDGAIVRGDVGRVRALLTAGVGGRSAERMLGPRLALALERGRIDIADLLRAHGAPLDWRALAGAAKSGDPAVRALVTQAALTPDDAANLLPRVVCDPQLLAAVLPALGSVPATWPGGDPTVTAFGLCPAALDALHAAGLRPSVGMLGTAVGRRDVEGVRGLLAAGVPVDGDATQRPLVTAAWIPGNAAVVALLLEAGADVREVDGRGSALHAVRDVDTLRLLLDAGAPVDLRLPGRGTPVEAAAGRDDPRILRMLVDAGADLAGSRAVEIAVTGRHHDTLSALLELGAPLGDAPGKVTDPGIAELLVRAGVDPLRLPVHLRPVGE